jgi:hypothetical protein
MCYDSDIKPVIDVCGRDVLKRSLPDPTQGSSNGEHIETIPIPKMVMVMVMVMVMFMMMVMVIVIVMVMVIPLKL